MKILVTGNEGFIGKNVASYLQQQGHEVEGWEWEAGVLPHTEGYDWCIHLGAISSTTYTDVDQILEQNFEFSVRLAQICENFGTNLQYASSASVYGPTTHFTEDGDDVIFEQTPLTNLSKEGQLFTYKHNGFWMPMDTLRDKLMLDGMCNKNTAPWMTWNK